MNDKMKKALPYLFMGIVSSATTLGAYKLLDNGTNSNDADYSFFAPKKGTTSFVGMNTAATSDDFVRAAKTTVPAVVTIKNYKKIMIFLNISSEIRSVVEVVESNNRCPIICLREWGLG